MTSSARIRARADQRAGVHEAVGHHAVEGRGDVQIGFQVLLGLDHGLRRRWLAWRRRAHQRLRGFHLLFRQDQLVAGHRAGRFGGLLETVVRALGGGQLRFGLAAVGFRGLHFGFGFGDLRLQFGRAQFGQQVALLHHAAAVHQHALDIAGHLGVQRDAQERQKLAGQIDGARHRLGNHRRQLDWFARGSAQASAWTRTVSTRDQESGKPRSKVRLSRIIISARRVHRVERRRSYGSLPLQESRRSKAGWSEWQRSRRSGRR